ncbi:formyltransferase family protein [Viridibacillus sp. FSL E2-0187]|uniref:methionyl-tRNA formyltransferase n=1 Tax=Viridibacillus sp. FSL E2-0187 TaxID=2921362 RepID=UPI0030F6E972
MKILYIGCVQSSENFLKALINNTSVDIVGIVTKKKSNFNADHVSLVTIAEQNNIDWLDYQDNNNLLNWISEKKPDIIYCFGWSHLLPKEIYRVAKKGAVGYHPALLPQNRGRHPIIWALALGLNETGSTFFNLTEEADAGDILSQRVVRISDSDDAKTLYSKLLKVGEEQVVKLTEDIINNRVRSFPQDESKVNYWRKRTKEDGKIDWRMGSKTILQLIKALTKPYVGAHFTYENRDYKVWAAKEIIYEYNIYANIEPGKIVAITLNSFIVKVADGLLEITDCELDIIPKVGEYL